MNPYGRKRLPDEQAHLNIIYYEYTRSAARRGIEFKLTKDEFKPLFKGDCFYCGGPPSNQIAGRHGDRFPPHTGIDRVHPDRGYEIGNVVSCCRLCNEVKRASTLEEFKRWVEGIHSRIDKIRNLV